MFTICKWYKLNIYIFVADTQNLSLHIWKKLNIYIFVTDIQNLHFHILMWYKLNIYIFVTDIQKLNVHILTWYKLNKYCFVADIQNLNFHNLAWHKLNIYLFVNEVFSVLNDAPRCYADGDHLTLVFRGQAKVPDGLSHVFHDPSVRSTRDDPRSCSENI